MKKINDCQAPIQAKNNQPTQSKRHHQNRLTTIKIGQGEQTKLIHSGTKRELRYKEDILPLKQIIDELAADAPTKKTEYGQTKIIAH